MRLAYLTTAYPEVSHTFIRREIVELARRGHDVLRVSVRTPSSRLVDPRDIEERERTHVLMADRAALVLATLRALLLRPRRFLRAFAVSLQMSGRSDRGLLRHLVYLVQACRLREVLAAHGSEHVHVHFANNACAVARLAHLLGGPRYSVTVHGPTEFDVVLGFSVREKVHDAAFTVAISHFGAAQLQRWTDPADWPRIAIVRCTIGDEFEKPAAPIPPGSRTFTCVGRLAPQKGQLLLVDAFAELIAAGNDARLVLAGDGELRAAIEERIAHHGLGDRIAITGWVGSEQIRELLGESRALVLPSFAEGLPVVIMEAFALGRPVVTTYVAGIPELVEPGRSGWLVPAGTVAPLVAALQEALDLPTARLDEMGAVGRARVLREHTTPGQVDALEALLRRAVS
ncbi:MAG: colanic acid biosynthesis glycosyltransferase WcaL [Proteobacteria bacterium]|nr:MAG: colanic acid biosynthesis glycosyltransferase WcaL [Pseudomonadota bacterium]